MPAAIPVPGATPVPQQIPSPRPEHGPEEPLYPYTIRPVRTKEDLTAAITLIKTYTAGLGVDLSYQDFESEMARMPGSYAPPSGELLIAVGNNNEKNKKKDNEAQAQDDHTPQAVLGCIALRELHVHTHKHMKSGRGQVPLQAQANRATYPSNTHPDSVSSNADDADADDDGKASANIDTKPQPCSKYCELKRLYVTPAARGLGVGKALVNAMLAVARQIGYEEVRLDTLPDMREAIAMYRDMGFGVVEKYYEKAIEGTVFLGLRLI